MSSQRRVELEIIKAQGLLKKKSPSSVLGFHPWQERYFVLTDVELLYYKKEKEFKNQELPTGVIPLHRIKKIELMEKEADGCRFNVNVDESDSVERSFELLAQSKADAQRWVDWLEDAMKRVLKGKKADQSIPSSGVFWKPDFSASSSTGSVKKREAKHTLERHVNIATLPLEARAALTASSVESMIEFKPVKSFADAESDLAAAVLHRTLDDLHHSPRSPDSLRTNDRESDSPTKKKSGHKRGESSLIKMADTGVPDIELSNMILDSTMISKSNSVSRPGHSKGLSINNKSPLGLDKKDGTISPVFQGGRISSIDSVLQATEASISAENGKIEFNRPASFRNDKEYLEEATSLKLSRDPVDLNIELAISNNIETIAPPSVIIQTPLLDLDETDHVKSFEPMNIPEKVVTPSKLRSKSSVNLSPSALTPTNDSKLRSKSAFVPSPTSKKVDSHLLGAVFSCSIVIDGIVTPKGDLFFRLYDSFLSYFENEEISKSASGSVNICDITAIEVVNVLTFRFIAAKETWILHLLSADTSNNAEVWVNKILSNKNHQSVSNRRSSAPNIGTIPENESVELPSVGLPSSAEERRPSISSGNLPTAKSLLRGKKKSSAPKVPTANEVTKVIPVEIKSNASKSSLTEIAGDIFARPTRIIIADAPLIFSSTNSSTPRLSSSDSADSISLPHGSPKLSSEMSHSFSATANKSIIDDPDDNNNSCLNRLKYLCFPFCSCKCNMCNE